MVAAGCAVVVLSARLGPVLPAAALPLLRAAAVVYADAECGCASSGVDCVLHGVDGAEPAPPPDELAARAAVSPVVLLTLDASSPAAAALRGAPVIPVAPPGGSALLDAVAVMDRLRSAGGCPWDAEQTHASLRQYLVEEAYELLDAIEHADAGGDRGALCEELGDVLLQVLFHARIAAEHPDAPFDIDDVARGLVDKLVSRHPHVFARSERLATAAEQEQRWEELKRAEKRRDSSMDGVALGQPALSLAAKLVSRAARAGLPPDLLPGVSSAALPDQEPGAVQGAQPGAVECETGEVLFAVAARTRLAGEDPEAALRAVALRFAHAVRTAESEARAAGLDPANLTPEAWHRCYPNP